MLKFTLIAVTVLSGYSVIPNACCFLVEYFPLFCLCFIRTSATTMTTMAAPSSRERSPITRPAIAPLERPLAELAPTLVAFESLVDNMFWIVVAVNIERYTI